MDWDGMRISGTRLASSCALALAACVGPLPDDIGIANGRLAPCPDSPNCVSSEATDEIHAIAPLRFVGAKDDAWRAARDAVAATPRTVIISQSQGYLHAEVTSALMRYVDDLELQLRDQDGVIAVRSASRVGYGDMGVNRARIEALRKRLVELGVAVEQ